MTRRGFLAGLGSLPFLSLFAKRAGASSPPAEVESSPVQEDVGSLEGIPLVSDGGWSSNVPCTAETFSVDSLERMYAEMVKHRDTKGHPMPPVILRYPPKGGV